MEYCSDAESELSITEDENGNVTEIYRKIPATTNAITTNIGEVKERIFRRLTNSLQNELELSHSTTIGGLYSRVLEIEEKQLAIKKDVEIIQNYKLIPEEEQNRPKISNRSHEEDFDKAIDMFIESVFQREIN
jgi:hypothetical protein